MWSAHAVLSLALLLAYGLAAWLARRGRYPQIPPCRYPQLPPLPVTLFLFLDRSGVLGGIVHLAAFTLLNGMVLTGAARAAGWLAAPSFAALTLFMAASAVFWATAVPHGRRYQGPAYVRRYAAANAAALLLLVGAAALIWRADAANPGALRHALVWFDGALYFSVVFLGFPYLGEVP